MDNIITNLIITLVLTLVVVVPVLIVSKNHSKKRKQKLRDLFDKLAQENNLNIADPDIFAMKIIGLDPSKHTLLFIDYQAQDPITLVVDIEKAGKCNVNQTTYNGMTSEVKLVFENRASNTILLYKQYKDKESHLKLITEKAEMWKKKLNSQLL